MSDLKSGHLLPSAAALRFGPAGRFELQPAERRLLADGQPVALGGRAFDVLLTLSSQPDHLVSKNELFARVWPGLVVEEANLQMQISNLRKVLGGDAIATVPGRGYRFIAPVVVPVVAPAAVAERSATASPSTAMAPPRQPQRLFGRAADLDRLEPALQAGGCVTLVGPAGVGKTSLARAVADRATAGGMGAGMPGPQARSIWVDLAPLNRPEQVAAALARALDAPLAEGDAAPQLLKTVHALLPSPVGAQAPLLVVLDNAEHLVDACAALVALLRHLPGLRLLVTSQLPLALADEQVQRLEPLALPPAEALGLDTGSWADGALALLVERITAADHRFTVSAAGLAPLREICEQLDGLPLALEMAAARVPLMGLQGVRDALAQRFALLTRGHRDASTRHRTLHNALDWSYRLLSAAEQRLFRALGVFAGGFTLELAVALRTGGEAAPDSPARWNVIDGLATLADRSLVAVSADDPPRYRLLDSMRAFALQALAESPGEAQAVRSAHAAAVAALFWPLAPGEPFVPGPYLAEIPNAGAAIAWARLHALDLAARLTARAAHVSIFSVWRNECAQWLRDLQPVMDSAAGHALPADVQAAWWFEMGRSATFLGDPQAPAAGRRALALWRPLQQPRQTLFAAVVWVRAITHAGDELDEACEALQAQAATMAAPTARERLWLHGALTKAALVRGDQAAVLAGRLAELALAQELGAEDMVDAVESNVVNALNALRRFDEAAARSQALLARIDERNGDANANLPWVLAGRMEALLETGRCDEARQLVPRAHVAGRRFNTLTALSPLPLLAALEGRFETAARLLGHVQQRFDARSAAPEPADAALLLRARQAAEEALGAAAFDSQWRRGRALDEDAAAALAQG